MCSSDLVAAPACPTPKVLRYAFPVAETGFDPARIVDLYSRIITAHIFESLYTYDHLARELEDAEVLHEMAREFDDESQEPDIQAAIDSIDSQLRQLDLRSLFTGEHDAADCIVQINAKDGGVDAQDWAEILLRMYSRWAERRGFTIEIDEYSEAAEAGIMSCEFTITGRYAYGLMTGERGTHRLVRISPFEIGRSHV